MREWELPMLAGGAGNKVRVGGAAEVVAEATSESETSVQPEPERA